MIIVDTSVCIDHLRVPETHLESLLQQQLIRMHPYLIGELALGSLRNYDAVIAAFLEMPQAVVATPDEVLFTIKRHSLVATGIGYVDAHILASATLMPDTLIWTRDKRLNTVAHRFGRAWTA